MAGLQDLPPELILKIVEFLNLNSYGYRLRKHYFKLLYLNRIWLNTLHELEENVLDITGSSTIAVLRHLAHLQHKGFAIGYKKLNLAPTKPEWNSVELILDLLNKIPTKNLRELTLSDIRLPFLLEAFGLECLRLENVAVTPHYIGSYHNLKSLSLKSCYWVNDDTLQSFLVNLSSLTSLSVENCKVTDVSMVEIAKLSKLEDVNLSGTLVSPSGLHFLGSNSKTIKSLSIANMPYTTRQVEAMVEVFGVFEYLEALDIRETKCALQGLIEMSKPFDLILLKFGDESFLQEPIVRTVLSLFTLLEYLEYSSRTVVTDLSLSIIPNKAKYLRILKLPRQIPSAPRLQLVHSSTLMKIPSSLTKLVEFEACGYEITADVLNAFAEHAVNIKRLIVHDLVRKNSRIDFKCLENLLEKRDLEILGCKNCGVDKKSLLLLQQRFPKTLIAFN